MTLLEAPSLVSGDMTSQLSRLLVNSLNETLHWLLLKVTVETEQREARREKLKVHYPQVSYNTGLVRELLSRTGLLSTLSNLSRQRLEKEINLETCLPTFQHIQHSDGWMTAKHFWGEESYLVRQFLQDNESFVSPELLAILCSSSDDLIKSMFQNPVDSQGKTVFSKEETQEDQSNKKHFLMESQQTLAVKFQYLVSYLMNLVTKTSLHFVFCLDSSQDLSSQLEIFKIKELNFVRRNGFSHRPDFASFLLRYCFLGKDFN